MVIVTGTAVITNSWWSALKNPTRIKKMVFISGRQVMDYWLLACLV